MRIVSTSPDNTEILCALGAESMLVGLSKHCDYPEHLLERLPVVSDFGKADIPAIQALKPDIVLCSTYYQSAMVETLVANHCRVFVTQPSDLASIATNFRILGNLVGKPDAGDQLAEDLIRAMPQQPEANLKVFAEEWGNPIVLAAPWIQEMIDLTGGTPVFPALFGFTHTNERIVEASDVLKTQADVVLLPWCGIHGQINLDKVITRPGWEQLPAVQKDQVFPLEDSFFVRPGPRLATGFTMLRELFTRCR